MILVSVSIDGDKMSGAFVGHLCSSVEKNAAAMFCIV